MRKDKPICGIADEFLIPEVLDKGLPFKSQIDPLHPDYESIATIKGEIYELEVRILTTRLHKVT